MGVAAVEKAAAAVVAEAAVTVAAAPVQSPEPAKNVKVKELSQAFIKTENL